LPRAGVEVGAWRSAGAGVRLVDVRLLLVLLRMLLLGWVLAVLLGLLLAIVVGWGRIWRAAVW
jgi:hypothetical protein